MLSFHMLYIHTSKNLTRTRPIECCPSFRVMAAGSHLEFEGHIHLKVIFYCFIAFLINENIGLHTGIEYLTFFMLWRIYRFLVMASGVNVTPWRRYISKWKFYCFIAFLTHENIGVDTGIESLTWIFIMLCHIYRFWVMAYWDGCTPLARKIFTFGERELCQS